MDRMNALRREVYYCEGNPKIPKNHKGVVGEAYCRAAKFFESNPDDFIRIANTELLRLNNEQDYEYEVDIYDDIYIVKYSYFYASECSYIYKRVFEKLFEEKGGLDAVEAYIRKNGFKIVSVGAGNFIDYWGLETALFLLDFSDDVISKIQYEAYEYKEWGCKGMNGTHADGFSRTMDYEKDLYRIKNKTFHIGLQAGDIFNAKGENADIIFFPNSFNELQKQRPGEFLELLKKLKSNNNDTFVAITYHRGAKDGKNSIVDVMKSMGEKIDDKVNGKNYFLKGEDCALFFNKAQYERNKKAIYSILEKENYEYISNEQGSPEFYEGNSSGHYNIMKNNKNLNYVIYKMPV